MRDRYKNSIALDYLREVFYQTTVPQLSVLIAVKEQTGYSFQLKPLQNAEIFEVVKL